MLLAIAPNPYNSGRPTRIIKMKRDNGMVFAIDVERLHSEPALLGQYSPNGPTWLRLIEACSVILAMMGVLGGYLISWWMLLPCLIAALLLSGTGRWMTGHLAKTAARRSHDTFIDMHSQGLVWLIAS